MGTNDELEATCNVPMRERVAVEINLADLPLPVQIRDMSRLLDLAPVSAIPISIAPFSGLPVSVIPVSAAPMSAAPNSLGRKPEVPGYELIRVLGRGGEGTVWEAVEKKLDRRVAIKIPSSRARVESAANLWNEARVAARIGDPSIVTVLDVGLTLDGRRFYAMELVRGEDVADIIAKGPIAPRRALEIAADVARAVAAAHAHGVVHRDLKPRNVIVDIAGHARVVDFGIALDLRSGADRLAGMLAGSPKYMAPEQIHGVNVGPHTDIWAIGVLLFEMLTGVSPFERADLLDVLEAVESHDPGVPSVHVPSIHRDVDAIVRRCLRVVPGDRFATAAALHECIRAVLEGLEVEIAPLHEPFSYKPRPSLAEIENGTARPRREDADKHLTWTWTLKSSPHELWPFVSDTQRFNQAVGLQPMDIVTVEEDGRRVQKGTQTTLGIPLSWQEFPFEFVTEREHSKFRLYNSGPVRGIWNRVTLTARADGGTDLTHELWVKTRNVLGRVASFVELDTRLARAVDKYYSKLDELLAAGRSPDEIDAHSPSTAQLARVEAGVTALLAQGFDDRVVRALEKHLLYAPDTSVSALRPHELAERWKTSRKETADALIHAANHGLLVPTWCVVCPLCRVASEQTQSLSAVHEQSRCPTCMQAFKSDLEDSMELTFAPDPAVRVVSGELFCYGAPATRPHVRAQRLVESREESTVSLQLEPGTYRIIGDQSRASMEILATATGFAERATISFDGAALEGGPVVVRAGEVAVVLRNASDAEELFRIETAAARSDVFTAAAALTHPSFRELFADQVPMAGTCMPVRALSFVFVRIESRALVTQLGDAGACVELSRVHARLAEEAARYQGTLVPSSLSLIALAFASDVAAVRAAFALRETVAAETKAHVALAVHQGGCIGLARGGRLEFFGETLHHGESLVQETPAGTIGVSEALMAHRRVALLVHESAGDRISIPPVVKGKGSGKYPKMILVGEAA